jgi:hypothetical protein
MNILLRKSCYSLLYETNTLLISGNDIFKLTAEISEHRS